MLGCVNFILYRWIYKIFHEPQRDIHKQHVDFLEYMHMNSIYFSMNFLLIMTPLLGLYYKREAALFNQHIALHGNETGGSDDLSFEPYLYICSGLHFLCWMTKIQMFKRSNDESCFKEKDLDKNYFKDLDFYKSVDEKTD